ncbi:protocatechuate 3,4-dioxygenase [Sphingobium sp. MK2]|uniref:DODA-type extradiol aromatic ring-opening family dioxygenase n=1 Tax=Sphingobium sp. MK2 TaxID=3116540 RepID=UPI0032E360F2
MAEIVLGIGCSHSPLLAIDWSEWQRRAEADMANPALNLSDGRFVTYDELVAEVGEGWAAVAASEQFAASAARCQAGLDQLADELAEAQVDVVVVIGDDQGELFALSNTPMISIYYGDEIATNDVWGRPDKPTWMKEMAKGYMMDKVHRMPAAPDLARQLIAGLVRRHVDVGASSHVDNPVKAGFGHAFGFVADRLFRDRTIPMLPVLLNTYFPPNVMTSARALEVGRSICSAIEESPLDLRVAVVASGGLSHFVVDEELDRKVLESLGREAQERLTTIAPGALNSGSSEILNWIMTAGAVAHLPLAWTEYEPVRRTAAGTGCGVGFACWRKE